MTEPELAMLLLGVLIGAGIGLVGAVAGVGLWLSSRLWP